MQTEFGSVGISLEKFFIENVSMPEDLKKEIFEYSRIDKLDLDKLTKFKTAKAIEAAALNEGGTAGAGMGMGMGFVLAQQMGGMMSPQMGGQQQMPLQQGGMMPPPMPRRSKYRCLHPSKNHQCRRLLNQSTVTPQIPKSSPLPSEEIIDAAANAEIICTSTANDGHPHPPAAKH